MYLRSRKLSWICLFGFRGGYGSQGQKIFRRNKNCILIIDHQGVSGVKHVQNSYYSPLRRTFLWCWMLPFIMSILTVTTGHRHHCPAHAAKVSCWVELSLYLTVNVMTLKCFTSKIPVKHYRRGIVGNLITLVTHMGILENLLVCPWILEGLKGILKVLQ